MHPASEQGLAPGTRLADSRRMVNQCPHFSDEDTAAQKSHRPRPPIDPCLPPSAHSPLACQTTPPPPRSRGPREGGWGLGPVWCLLGWPQLRPPEPSAPGPPVCSVHSHTPPWTLGLRTRGLILPQSLCVGPGEVRFLETPGHLLFIISMTSPSRGFYDPELLSLGLLKGCPNSAYCILHCSSS